MTSDIQHELLTILMNTFSVLDILLILQTFFGVDRCKKLWHYFAIGGIFIVISLGLDRCLTEEELLYFILICLYIAFVGAVFAKERKWRPVLLTIPAILLYLQWDNVCALLDVLFHLGKYAYTWAETATDLYEILSDILLFVILLYVTRVKKIEKRVLCFTTGETILVSVFCIFCPVLTMVLQYLEDMFDNFMYSMAWVSFVLILNFAVFYGIFHRKNAKHYRALSENYKEQFNTEYSYFKEYKKEQKDMAGFRHDWNNHLLLLTSMFERGEYEKAKDYFESLSQKNKTEDESILTGNEIMDMILNAKQEKLKQEKIEVTYSKGLEELRFMEPVDCCILFSNLIDNAIEANCKCDRERYIAIDVCRKASTLLVTIENKMNGDVKMEKERLMTTKEDGQLHGIGTQNAFEMIRKYHGEYRIEIKDNTFAIQMLFPWESS